jgi:hypothetical protein
MQRLSPGGSAYRPLLSERCATTGQLTRARDQRQAVAVGGNHPHQPAVGLRRPRKVEARFVDRDCKERLVDHLAECSRGGSRAATDERCNRGVARATSRPSHAARHPCKDAGGT